MSKAIQHRTNREDGMRRHYGMHCLPKLVDMPAVYPLSPEEAEELRRQYMSPEALELKRRTPGMKGTL